MDVKFRFNAEGGATGIPFTADNTTVKMTLGGKRIRLPVSVDVPIIRELSNLEEDMLVLLVRNGLLPALAVRALCDGVQMALNARGNVPTNIRVSVAADAAALILAAQNSVKTWIAVSPETSGAIAMLLRAYQASPSIALSLVGDEAFKTGFTLNAHDGAESYEAITPELHAAWLELTNNNSVTISPIQTILEQLSSQMYISDGWQITLLGDLDPKTLDWTDDTTLYPERKWPVTATLEVGLECADPSEVRMLIRAHDGTGIITDPVEIASIGS